MAEMKKTSEPTNEFKLNILESEKDSDEDLLQRLKEEESKEGLDPEGKGLLECIQQELEFIDKWMDDLKGKKKRRPTREDIEFRIEMIEREMKFYGDIMENDDNLTDEEIEDFQNDILKMVKWRAEIATSSIRKIGRNEPCPCGSGKKYKNCCMNKEDRGADHAQKQLTWEEASTDHAMLQMDGMLPMLGTIDKEEKIEALEEIIAGRPDFFPAILDHGMQLLTDGNLKGAREDIDKGLKIMKERDVKAEEINDTIDNICHNLETYFCYREAIDYYERILDLDVDKRSKATAYGDIANCCHHIGDPDRALEEAEKAVSTAPDHCKSLSNLGWIKMTRGEVSSAKEVLEKAVEADPEDDFAKGNLQACIFMIENELKDWTSFLLKDQDQDNIERMMEENDDAGLEKERISYNRSLLQAFRHELAIDDSMTYDDKYDLFFSLAYALKLLDDVNFDHDLYFSDILEVETSMDRFLARFIVKTSDIDDDIFDGSIDAILEFYRFLESKDVVDGFKDLEGEVEELREEFREKMHVYNLARRSGDPDAKMKARDKLFGDLYWSF